MVKSKILRCETRDFFIGSKSQKVKTRAFCSGMNTKTYQYYIDFAAKNHLEYIIIDEGWSGKESLMSELNEEIDLPQLIAYGQQKGVGIILWSSWRNLIGDPHQTSPRGGFKSLPLGGDGGGSMVMQHYADMGIKGFKVDFFDRDDQQVIASAYQLAACAARHHLLLDYHGLKPFGIQRAYPNIVNFEGVKGLENSKWHPRAPDGDVHHLRGTPADAGRQSYEVYAEPGVYRFHRTDSHDVRRDHSARRTVG